MMTGDKTYVFVFIIEKWEPAVYHLLRCNKLELEDSLMMNDRLCSSFLIWTKKYAGKHLAFTGTTPLPLERF